MENVIQNLVARFKLLSWPYRILSIIGLPLILLFLVFKVISAISAARYDRKFNETRDKSKQLDDEIKNSEVQTAREEGRVEELENQRREALKESRNDDPASFFNNRDNNNSDK